MGPSIKLTLTWFKPPTFKDLSLADLLGQTNSFKLRHNVPTSWGRTSHFPTSKFQAVSVSCGRASYFEGSHADLPGRASNSDFSGYANLLGSSITFPRQLCRPPGSSVELHEFSRRADLLGSSITFSRQSCRPPGSSITFSGQSCRPPGPSQRAPWF